MTNFERLALLLCIAVLGCAGKNDSLPPHSAPHSSSRSTSYGYALLHGILEQEKQVSQLLIIKRDREALGQLIDRIAETCDTASKQLDDLAQRTPSLDLSDTGLPAVEVHTREAIAAFRREILLASSGRELELQLLLTQVEGLTYASTLADTLSRSEPDPERLEFVRALWKDLRALLADVQALLRRPIPASG